MEYKDNKEVYSTIEFNSWAHREGLIKAERFLIEKYLNKKGRTLEAGTGCGRILLELKQLGFSSLYGIDFIPEFIEVAKKRDSTKSIVFEVQDATNLHYKDSYFVQVIYLQQIISLIESEETRIKAMKEAYCVLKPEGIALFSFLCFEARSKKLLYRFYLNYLRILRILLHKKISIQYIPWLKLGKKPNIKALFDTGPYVYWYKCKEIYTIVQEVGFKIIAVGSSKQIEENKIYVSCENLNEKDLEGMLYYVCTK